MAPRRSTAAARETRWLTGEEEQAWRAVASMMHEVRSALECQLERDSGLSFIEYHTLARLSEEPTHTLRMSQLAELTNASLSRLSHLVTRLEKWGFVRREPDPTDGRYTNAMLTQAGYDKLRESAPGHVEAVRQLVIDVLSPIELAKLQAFCGRIVASVGASAWKQPLT